MNRLKQTPDKSAFTDAHLLPELVRVGHLPRAWLAPQTVRKLRQLTRRRQDLVNRRRAVKLRVGALLPEHRLTREGKSWTWRGRPGPKQRLLPTQTRWEIDDCRAELQSLTQRIARVEGPLREMIQDDPTVQKLCKLRGIGLVTACVIRAEIEQTDPASATANRCRVSAV